MNSHTASAKKQGLTNDMLGELMSVVGLFNTTNRLVEGYLDVANLKKISQGYSLIQDA